jgi:hypothetical protein
MFSGDSNHNLRSSDRAVSALPKRTHLSVSFHVSSVSFSICGGSLQPEKLASSYDIHLLGRAPKGCVAAPWAARSAGWHSDR